MGIFEDVFGAASKGSFHAMELVNPAKAVAIKGPPADTSNAQQKLEQRQRMLNDLNKQIKTLEKQLADAKRKLETAKDPNRKTELSQKVQSLIDDLNTLKQQREDVNATLVALKVDVMKAAKRATQEQQLATMKANGHTPPMDIVNLEMTMHRTVLGEKGDAKISKLHNAFENAKRKFKAGQLDGLEEEVQGLIDAMKASTPVDYEMVSQMRKLLAKIKASGSSYVGERDAKITSYEPYKRKELEDLYDTKTELEGTIQSLRNIQSELRDQYAREDDPVKARHVSDQLDAAKKRQTKLEAQLKGVEVKIREILTHNQPRSARAWQQELQKDEGEFSSLEAAKGVKAEYQRWKKEVEKRRKKLEALQAQVAQALEALSQAEYYLTVKTSQAQQIQEQYKIKMDL